MIEKILKIARAIDSCETIDQLRACERMIENFIKISKPNDSRIKSGLNLYYLQKLSKLF